MGGGEVDGGINYGKPPQVPTGYWVRAKGGKGGQTNAIHSGIGRNMAWGADMSVRSWQVEGGV